MSIDTRFKLTKNDHVNAMIQLTAGIALTITSVAVGALVVYQMCTSPGVVGEGQGQGWVIILALLSARIGCGMVVDAVKDVFTKAVNS